MTSIKKLILAAAMLLFGVSAFAQAPSDSTTTSNYILANIKPNGTQAITGQIMQNALIGIMNSYKANGPSPALTAVLPLIYNSAVLSIQNSGTAVGIFNAFRVNAKGLIDSAWTAVYPNTLHGYQTAYGTYGALRLDSVTFTLTTTGSSGAATFSGNTLNIPQYSGGGGGIAINATVTGSKGWGLFFGSPTTSGIGNFMQDSAHIRYDSTNAKLIIQNRSATTATPFMITDASNASTFQIATNQGSYVDLQVLGNNTIVRMTSISAGFQVPVDCQNKLSVQGPNNSSVPFEVDGLTGQSVDLVQVYDGSSVLLFNVDKVGRIGLSTTTTAIGTTGNVTINKPSGTVNIAAAGSTVTVTNSEVSATSIVYCVIRTSDATAYIKNVVPASGSFVVNLGAAATGTISIGFVVFNP